MKNRDHSFFWGIFVIFMGALFLINNLGLFEGRIFFDGWWTVFIIVPSVASLFYKDEFMPGVLGIMIGILLLMAAQEIIAWSMVGKIFMPFLIICIGVSLLLKPKFNTIVKKQPNGQNDYAGIFGGVDEKLSDKFLGGRCLAVFGGVTLDLTEAIITEDIVIDCVTVFGGTEIHLPKNLIVKTSGISVFGGAENHFSDQGTKKQPTVYINHVTIFGGVEIK